MLSGGPSRRHSVVALGALVLLYLFWLSRPDWAPMHRWNRAFADVSVVMLALAMTIGPMSRVWRRAVAMLPWRREAGIWAVVFAVAHTLVILDGWVEWNLVRLFGFVHHPLLDRYVMVLHGFGFGNVVGIVGLLYAGKLAATSNSASQRVLGGSSWKFVQLSSYTLWMLVVLHTGYFLYLHFLDFHRAVPKPNWLQIPFAVVVAAVVSLQSWAFVETWQRRAHSDIRRP